MAFDNSYFEDEIREGFYIPGMIKRSWATQLEILGNVIKVCENHNLKWFAGYGTLIGAVRHHGFIPWDDDLDICMLKDDYDKFVEYAQKELPESYRVLNIYLNEEYHNFLTRVVNHDLIDTTESFLDENCGFPFASGIDIFPLHYLYPDDEVEEERRIRAFKVWDLITDDGTGEKVKDGYKLIKQIEEASGLKVDMNIPIENSLYRLMDTIFSEAPKEGATHVTLMPVWAGHKAQKFPIELFDDLISMPFEDTTVLVPASYNKVLKMCYGNWEVANRKGGLHDYPFYGPQEEKMEEHYGTLPYKYYYSKEINKVCEVELATNEIVSIIDTLKAASDMIQLLISQGNYQPIPELLENCQELAIKAGTSIENIYKEDGNTCVNKLEEYCECIYNLNEDILNESSEVNGSYLSRCIVEIKTEYSNLYSLDDVVFISYRSSDWIYVDSIYKKFVDEGKKITVLNVPYFEKTMNGNLGVQMQDNTGYPEYINPIDYTEYGFAYHHPKEIIIQNPFDQYGSAISVHPMFYSTTLKDFTGKLTYVQSFGISDIIDGDEKGKRNAKYFIISPGVIYSDEIIVESESMKDLYINILSENTDLDQSEITSKIKTFNDLNISKQEDVNSSSSSKKRIIFYIGFADIYENASVFLTKLNKTINIFNSQPSIEVIWAQDSGLENNIQTYTKELYDEYLKIKNDFINNGGHFIETDNWKDTLENADAFYGSAGFAMNMAVLREIPVMEWNVKIV